MLPSPKDAAIFASEQRRQLPAVRQAEREFDEDTRRARRPRIKPPRRKTENYTAKKA